MLKLLSSLVGFFRNANSSYNFKSMSLKRGRGSSFWTPEKESKMLELFSKNYSYEDVGRAIGATKGQLATRVRMLRQKGIEVIPKKSVKKTWILFAGLVNNSAIDAAINLILSLIIPLL